MNIGRKVSLLLSFVLMASLMSSSPSSAEALVITGDATISAIVGTPISPITYTASGGTAPYTITISAPMDNGFTATPSATSMVVSGSAIAAQSAGYTITVTDSASATATVSFTLTATIPALVISGSATISALVGTPITPTTYTASGGTAPYTITISAPMDNGFTANPSATTMVVSGNAVAAQSAGYTITVTDSASATATVSFTITSTIPALSISSSPTTISALVGTPITPITYTASGGTAPYTVTISTPMVNGFTATPSGTDMVVSGSAVAAQSDTYTITVTDSASATATVSFTITSTIPALVISGSATISALVGIPITPTAYTISGGTGPYSIDISTPMVNGFTASTSADGMVVSGAAAAAQSDTYTINVTDSASATTSITFTVTSTMPALAIDGPLNIAATVGSPITPTAYTASGGTGPYVITISAPMDNGFIASQSGNDMVVSGSAVAEQNAGYTITVTDSTSATASITFTINSTIPALFINGPLALSATVGTSISATYTASGGIGPYTITISTPMANGFTATPSETTMVVSGTAIAPQSDTYTITVTDSTSATASITFTITSNFPPLNIAGPSQINMVAGNAQFIIYTVSGAVGSVAFNLTTPADGISISSSNGGLTVLGSLTPGNYSIVISAIDSRNVTGFITVSITFDSGSTGPGTPSISNELRVIAPNLQIIEGQVVPDLTPTYSNAIAVSTPAICEIFSTGGTIAREIFAGKYDILCRGVTTSNGATVVYVPGVLKVAIKTQDSAETKLEASIERPRVIYVSPNVETDSTVTLQNTRGSSVISVHFDQKSVLTTTTIYLTPWPNNIVDKTTPVVNITAKDNKNETLASLEKPMSLKFPKVPTNSIPVFSADGIDWINFPQITKGDLTSGNLEGYYADSNGEITILSQELGLIGFRLAQSSFTLGVRNKKSLYGLTEQVQVNLPRLPGTGGINYESLLPRACSISTQGVVKSITGGECLVIAKKASDNKYSTGTSEILTLKFASPPTPKPTAKPTKSPTTKPKPGPTTPTTTQKAPKGFAIIPGIDGVYTPAKLDGAKNSAVLKLGSQISAEFNQQLNSQISVSLTGLDKGAVISPILVTPEGVSAILQSGKYDSVKQYVSQSLKFTKTGVYKIIFRIAGTNTARVISISIK